MTSIVMNTEDLVCEKHNFRGLPCLMCVGEELIEGREKYRQALNRFAETTRKYYEEKEKNKKFITFLEEIKEYSEYNLGMIGGGEILRKKIVEFLNQQKP